MARKMKDSGIEWIGEIPEGWEITKIKHIVSSVTDIDHFMPDSAEFGIPYLMIGDLKDLSSSIDWDSSKKISIEDYKKLSIKSRPQIGDIIFARYASIGTTCYIDTDRDFLVSYACLTIHPSDLIIGKFLSYYLKSSSFAEDVLRRTNSNTQGNVGKDSLVNATIVLPSIIEQTQIVNFLDAKCSDINAMLSKTRSSIEEYKKLKQAVITQTVTKGVRGEREMTDSGVDWIGEIPKEWDIIKSSRIIKTTQNGLSRRDLEKSEGQIILKLKNITSDGKVDYSFLNRITLSQNELSTYALTTGDFLFVRVNGSKSLVGKCAIFEAISEIVAYNDHIIRVKLSNQCYNRFFLWYLYSCCGKAEIDLHTSTAAGQYTISGDGLRDITLVFPPIDEQKEIADYLDAKCAEIDRLIAKKEQLVKELESYKKSLIYEVVTGKREV